MPATKILVIDDEQSILDLVTAYLGNEGYEFRTAMDGPSGLKAARVFKPDLIVLDIMLPGMDGIELLSRLRRESDVYVIMLTAKSEETDKIVGLSVGADDYLTKPFSPRELVSRVRAVLRRTESSGVSTHGLIEVDDRLKLDFDRREIWVDGELVKLRPTEYRLLYHLVQNAGWVITHDQLLSRVWGYEYRDEPHYVRLYINYLRKKLEQDPANPEYIQTERGVGYRFVDFRRQKAEDKNSALP